MLWIVVVVLLAILATVGFIAGKAGVGNKPTYTKNAYGREEKTRTEGANNVVAFGSLAVGLVVILLISLAFSFTKVNTGNVGVVYSFGSIDGRLEAGTHFIAPWKSVKSGNIQTQTKEFNDLGSFTKEGQEVLLNLGVNYQLEPSNVVNLYATVGPDWFDKLVPQRVNQITKATTAEYEAINLGTKREEIKKKITERLNEALGPYSISIVDVNIQNITYSEKFTAAIEAKQEATQQAARAQAEVARAEAEADKVRAEARGQADANRILASSITPEVLASRQIELQRLAIEKLNPNAQIVYLDPRQGGLINLNPKP